MSSSSGEDGAEEIEFLKDQVHRLSVSLGVYQKKHPHLPSDDGMAKSYNPKAPWLTKRMLSPLLAEYDVTIEELSQQISMYQGELESMTSRVEQVTQENARLHSELRKSLEARIEAVTQSSSKSSSGVGFGGVMDALQQQMEMVNKDRDNYRELLKKTANELDLLQRIDQDKTRKLLSSKAELVTAQQTAIIAKKTAEELEFSCNNLDEERTRCLKAVKAQEAELSALQDNFSQAKTELRTVAARNEELKKSLDEITFQLRRREAERVKALDTENSLDDRLHIMQITNADVEGKLLATQREMAGVKEEKAELEETLSSVQARVSSLEQREHEAVSHVKESMQIAESALLEKEQASIREQQLNKEVERLRATVTTILKEAGERTRREVDLLRDECNKNIDKMGVEIHRLEQECGERQAQLERCQREKKVVEKELEKAQAQKPLDIVQTGENLHELQKRTCVAERARDDAMVRVEALTAKAKTLESSLADEKQANMQLADEHRKWQKQVQGESHDLREQKIKAMGQADDLKQKLRLSEQARETAKVKQVQELATLEQRQEMKEKEMVYRLESSEEAHRKSIQELRNLLTAQHRVGTKWREESKTLAQKFERTISNLKAELLRYRSRSDELTKQLNHLKHVKDDLSKRLKDATNSNSSLQQRLKEAEAHSETAMEQVAELASREKQLLQERRELNRQLDKFKLHIRNSGTTMPGSSQHLHSSYSRVPLPRSTNTMSGLYPHHPHYSVVLPASSSLAPPTPPAPIHSQDNAQWNETLTQLKQSIQQVREDLGLRERYRGADDVQGEGEDTVSDSVLSTRDLSHSTRFVS